MAKPKTLAMLAFGRRPPEQEDDNQAGKDADGDDDAGEGLAQAMSDLLDAVKAEDPEGMAAAFQDAVEMTS